MVGNVPASPLGGCEEMGGAFSKVHQIVEDILEVSLSDQMNGSVLWLFTF